MNVRVTFFIDRFPGYELFSKHHSKLSINFYLYTLTDFNIFDIFQYIILVILFNSQILSSLVSGSVFKLTPGSFDMTLIVFNGFLAFWFGKVFQARLVQPWNQSLLKECRFLLVGNYV